MDYSFEPQSIDEELAMDELEKNIRDIHIATYDDVTKIQDSISENIPLDLILEILSRLPVKSLLRFRCVSKLWSSFTELQSFVNLYESRSSTRPPNLLIAFSESIGPHLITQEKKTFLYPQHHNNDKSCSSIYSYEMTGPNCWKYAQSESVQGLILVKNFTIWNPSLRQFLNIPQPNENIETYNFCFLGYNPLEGKHKLLCLMGEYSESSQVLTLGAQESWRIITKCSPMPYPTVGHGRCLNGTLYYEAYDLDVGKCILMSFDFTSELFNPINVPNIFICIKSSNIILYDGTLALVYNKPLIDGIDIYILKDANGHEWTKVSFLHLPFNTELTDILNFEGVTNSGELIFGPFKFLESFYILYFDPKSNTIRETFCEELSNSNKVGQEFNIDIFPNHIESLVSLKRNMFVA